MSLATFKPKTSEEPETLTILAVGPWDRGEFAIVREQIAPDATWVIASDREIASEMLTRSELPVDVVLLAQPLPGDLRQSDLETLRRLAPLAQIVVAAGTWCEGELRTGKPLAGVLRLYWYEVQPWWRTFQSGHDSWLPCLDGPFAPRELEFDHELSGLAAICSPTLSSFETLSEAFILRGLNCAWCREFSNIPANVTLGIWDGGQLDTGEFERLRAFTTKIQERGAALIVLLDFPRKEHLVRLHSLGCETVFGKPYIVTELVSAIHRLRFRK